MKPGEVKSTFHEVKELTPDTERIAFGRHQITQETLDHLRTITCECGRTGTFRPAGVANDARGTRLMAACTECRLLIETWFTQRTCFTFDFDQGAHSITWDTEKLLQLVAKAGIPAVPINLNWVDVFYELNGAVAVDTDKAREYAMTRPLDRPILVVQHPSALWETPGFPFILPIDGWHRIYRAHMERKTLTALVAPREIEQLARVRDVVYV